MVARVALSTRPPFASIGIVPIVGILKPLNPHQLPPTPGTQFGTVILNLRLLSLLIKPFTVPSTPLNPPMTALMGVLAMSANPLNTLVKIVFMPCQA